VGCGVRGVCWMGWMESGVLGDFEMDCGIFGWGFGNSAVWGFLLWADLSWSWGSTRLWSTTCDGVYFEGGFLVQGGDKEIYQATS